MRLENLAVDYGVKCRIWQADRVVEEGTFTAVRCVDPDLNVRRQFFSLISPFLLALGKDPSPSVVAAMIDGLVELFRALMKPSRKSIQGLWAELYLISRARDCEALVSAWHVSPGERYDFAEGNQRLEVKCAAGRGREHHFSLEQVSAPMGSVVLIASICTERSGGGTSLDDLLNRVRSRLAGDAERILHLETVVGATLGRTLMVALDEAYDLQMAEQSLRFFEAWAIPRPGGIPNEVSDVRFIVDLGQVASIDLSTFAGSNGLFEAALPE